MRTHLKQIHYYGKITQAMITQKNSVVDIDLQKIGENMMSMLKGENQTENRPNQDFSQDDNYVKKRKQLMLQVDKDTAQQKSRQEIS